MRIAPPAFSSAYITPKNSRVDPDLRQMMADPPYIAVPIAMVTLVNGNGNLHWVDGTLHLSGEEARYFPPPAFKKKTWPWLGLFNRTRPELSPEQAKYVEDLFDTNQVTFLTSDGEIVQPGQGIGRGLINPGRKSR